MTEHVSVTGAVINYLVTNMDKLGEEALTALGNASRLRQRGIISVEEAANMARKVVYGNIMHYRPRSGHQITETGNVDPAIYVTILEAVIFDKINWYDVGAALVAAYQSAGDELNGYAKGCE